MQWADIVFQVPWASHGLHFWYNWRYQYRGNTGTAARQQADCSMRESDIILSISRISSNHWNSQLNLQPDDHLLDIGCGWGTLAAFAHKNYGCKVTGVTLGKNQTAFGNQRILDNVSYCAMYPFVLLLIPIIREVIHPVPRFFAPMQGTFLAAKAHIQRSSAWKWPRYIDNDSYITWRLTMYPSARWHSSLPVFPPSGIWSPWWRRYLRLPSCRYSSTLAIRGFDLVCVIICVDELTVSYHAERV